jgi:hypothetical protein
MRGLDSRIHAVGGTASVRCKDVDGRIKSGHDDCKLHPSYNVIACILLGQSRATRHRRPSSACLTTSRALWI